MTLEHKPMPWDERVAEWMRQNAAPDVVPLGPEMIWTDIETTGLDENTGMILEVACMVTDRYGYVLGSFETLVRDSHYQPETTRQGCIDFVQTMHDKSGLWDLIDQASIHTWSVSDAYQALEDFLEDFFPTPVARENLLPLSGSSVHFDRKWMEHHFPGLLSQWTSHRDIDVSSTKEQIKLHNPDLMAHLENFWTPISAHRGTPDLIDSIMEYRFQIAEFFWTRENAEGFSADVHA